MTAARDHQELYDLIGHLRPDQVRRLLRLVESDPDLSEQALELCTADETPLREMAITGIFDSGEGDLSERVEEFTTHRFNYSL